MVPSADLSKSLFQNIETAPGASRHFCATHRLEQMKEASQLG
jgi:hypothetical protein